MEEAVLYAVENNIATITMNRPKSLNSMNDALIDGLHAAITKAAADAEVRAIVLTGNGKAFCAGGDLSYLNGLEGVAAKKDFIAKVGDVAKRLTTIPKPDVGLLPGGCICQGALWRKLCQGWPDSRLRRLVLPAEGYRCAEVQGADVYR